MPAKLVVKVISAETKVPQPWVYVTIDGLSGTTNVSGETEFILPTGSYTLTIRHIEFRPVTSRINLPEEREYRITFPLVRARL